MLKVGDTIHVRAGTDSAELLHDLLGVAGSVALVRDGGLIDVVYEARGLFVPGLPSADFERAEGSPR